MGFVLLLIGLLTIAVVALVANHAGYERGQRDALNGRWRWTKATDKAGNEYVVHVDELA